MWLRQKYFRGGEETKKKIGKNYKINSFWAVQLPAWDISPCVFISQLKLFWYSFFGNDNPERKEKKIIFSVFFAWLLFCQARVDGTDHTKNLSSQLSW